MKFDLENLNPGTFFPFSDGTEGGVTIRVASGDALSEIEKKCVKRKFEWKRNQRFEVIDEDDEKRSLMMWDYVIIDWDGIFDLNDAPIPCNKANKNLLMQNSVKFSTFVGKCIQKLNEQMEEYEEELEKNLQK